MQQWGLTAVDDNLPPDQKKAKLEQQLGEIEEDLDSEVKSKKGLGVYHQISVVLHSTDDDIFIPDKLVKFYAADPVAQQKAVQVSPSFITVPYAMQVTVSLPTGSSRSGEED